jgi:hypothetical protein
MNTRWPHLKLLPSGILPPNPSELLTSDKMIKVIDQLKSMADYVMIISNNYTADPLLFRRPLSHRDRRQRFPTLPTS